jgi:hypothetical protein
MRHRLADSGEDTNEGLHATTLLAGLALLPLACGPSLDDMIAITVADTEQRGGETNTPA